MTRLALGPLILTGLFLVGSVCADPVRAEEIDLASQPGFNTMRRDWIEDGSTIRLKADLASGKTDQLIIEWPDWQGQFSIHVTPTGAEPGIAETDFLVHLESGNEANCALANPGGKIDAGVYVYELARRELPMPDDPDSEVSFYIGVAPEPPLE